MDDEKIYNEILEELRANGPRQGLWAKCFTEAKGNENAAKALYFKYRAQQLVQQKEATPPKSDSTDLVNHSLTNLKKESRQDNIYGSIALYTLVLLVLITAVLWESLYPSLNDKVSITKVEDRQARQAEVNAQVAGALATVEKAAVERNKTLSAAVDAKQITEAPDAIKSKVSKYEMEGKAIEKDLATNLHSFKYKLMSGEKITHYSKDEINFYPLDYKFSIALQDDAKLIAKKEFIGNPNKGQPKIVMYSIQGTQGMMPHINYCYKSLEFDALNINCFDSFSPAANAQIYITGNLIQLTFKGVSKDDWIHNPTIPVTKLYEFIDNKLVCTAGNCEF